MTPLEIARAHWDLLPDWVEALALACMQSSQAKTASALHRTPAVVSQVLRNKYPGNMSDVEERVRGAFMGGMIDCPALGEIDLLTCRTWRDRAKAPSLHNPTRVRMAKSCPRCPHFVERTPS